MSPTVMILIAVIAVLLVFGIVAGAKKQMALNKKMEAFLKANGFESCKERSEYILAMVRSLGQCREERTFSIRNPKRAKFQGKEVFFYEKHRYTTGRNIILFEEFLFPFNRKSDKPVVIYLGARELPDIFKKSLMGLENGVYDSCRHDMLKKLEIPRALHGGSVLAAFGPPGASLFDLLDSKELTIVQSGADCGAFVFMAYKNMASVCCMTKYMNLDIDVFWNYIRQLLDYDA